MIPNLHLATKQVDGVAVPILPKPYTQIVQAIERAGLQSLQMEVVEEEYSCGTVRCIAGWTLHLCGIQGVEFLEALGEVDGCVGTIMNDLHAARLILDASSDLDSPGFFPDDYEEDGDDYEEDGSNSVKDINFRALACLCELAAQEAAYA